MMSPLTTSLAGALETAPRVIAEQQGVLFKFYANQALHDGMTYGNELYRLVNQCSINHRLEVYRLGCELIEQGIPTIISVSEERYSVWISLRHSSAAVLTVT